MEGQYQNRQAAGKKLAENLMHYAAHQNVLVLGLPRGGVPVAFEVAHALQVPLDVLIVRKLGVPHHEELAMGAVALGGAVVLNEDIVQDLGISPDAIMLAIAKEEKELTRREKAYRGDKPFPAIKDNIIIVVDDGMATGATMRAAVMCLRQYQPEKIVVAVPVAAQSTCQEIEKLADDFLCLLQPKQFYAVGAWYKTFEQTDDDEVKLLLGKGMDPG